MEWWKALAAAQTPLPPTYTGAIHREEGPWGLKLLGLARPCGPKNNGMGREGIYTDTDPGLDSP